MTVETETAILKALEKLEQKLDKFIETTNQKFENVQKDLTDLKVGQARLEGKVDTNRVEIQNIKEDVKDIKVGNRWILGLVVTIVGSIIYIVSNLLPKI